jgi:hypothetical protein
MCRIRLSEGISKYQQLKKKSAATALNIVLASAHIQMTQQYKPHWATRQQAIAKTPAKWTAYQIPSVIVVFVFLVLKVWFVSFIPKRHKRPWTC